MRLRHEGGSVATGMKSAQAFGARIMVCKDMLNIVVLFPSLVSILCKNTHSKG